MQNLLTSLFLSLFLVACGPFTDGGASEEAGDTVANLAPTEQAIIVTSDARHSFDVEIADDAAEQRRGLMYRREMAADAGMLFLYEEEEPLSYWMQNTYISLDIIYIDHAGRIVSIAKNTVPLSERSIPSNAPAQAVLEINAGLSDELGIDVGDQVLHPFFEN